ncbi:hypothetical protein MXB_4314, partial [Myxobolus squamalis]
MHIKSIILDGFKSYAKRTEISNFDPFFNAITGLNGSGKSNILDGICFLLGISNLSNELIFKSGQAGVTKASVTILFDNFNKKQSPIGYEHFEEITITRIVAAGGRNKYLINGCNSTHARIHDFFCSIQMNVNNPHFLIMQILSMIEEATGTKMYENKRQIAFDTIAKKEIKLNEINRMLNEDITPTITKLKEERTSYLEYQKITRELEHTKRICLAYDYMKLKEKKIQQNMTFEELGAEKQILFKESTELDFQLQKITHEIDRVQIEIDSRSGNEFQEKLTQLKELSSREIKDTSNYQYSIETLNSLNKRLNDIDLSIQKIIVTLDENNGKNTNFIEELKKLKETKDQLQTDVETAVNLVQSATIGISDANVQTQSITELLIGTTFKNEKELKSARCNENSIEENKLKLLESEIEAQLNLKAKLNFDDNYFQESITNKKNIQTEISTLTRSIESFVAKNPSLVFSSFPSNFDPSVYGLVSSLFDVMDDKFTIAMESAAGGKLFNVVVDTDDTTKKLIKGGTLKKRVTFIALNRVTPYSLNNKVVEKAQNLVGKDKVWPAISLLQYDEHLQPAIEFVFGGTLICAGASEAKRLAYDKSVGCRCVTLDGDIFESSGILTGGSRPTHNLLLKKQQELNLMKKNIGILVENEGKMKSIISKLHEKHESFTKISKVIEEKQYELKLLQSKLKSSNRFQIQEEIAKLNKDLAECKVEENKLLDLIKKENESRADLEEKSNDEASYKKELLEKYETNLNKIKSQFNQVSNRVIEIERIVHDIRFECEELEIEKLKLLKEMAEVSSSIKDQQARVSKYELIMTEIKRKLENLENQIEQIKLKMNECNQQMQVLNTKKCDINKIIFENQLKTKELCQNINNLKQIIQQISVHIHDTLNQNQWLENEEKNFNSSSSVYNFTSVNITALKEKLDWLETSVKKMSRTINTRAMNMLSQAEEKYNDLMRKKKIVENDRKKIELIIQDLDIKKNEALKSSSVKVNKDFGNIFSTLLPDGMFANANVLYKTKFNNGVSNVSRHDQIQKKHKVIENELHLVNSSLSAAK